MIKGMQELTAGSALIAAIETVFGSITELVEGNTYWWVDTVELSRGTPLCTYKNNTLKTFRKPN